MQTLLPPFFIALSGLAIVGFVIVHLIGTLKIFLGPDSTNDYGEALRELGGHLCGALARLDRAAGRRERRVVGGLRQRAGEAAHEAPRRRA